MIYVGHGEPTLQTGNRSRLDCYGPCQRLRVRLTTATRHARLGVGYICLGGGVCSSYNSSGDRPPNGAIGYREAGMRGLFSVRFDSPRGNRHGLTAGEVFGGMPAGLG